MRLNEFNEQPLTSYKEALAQQLAKQLGRQLDVERHDDRGAGYTILGQPK